MVKAVEFAKKEGVYVSANAEDASRSDEEFLLQFVKAAKEAGADRIRYCDTVGIMTPIEIYKRIERIRNAVDIDIEMHTHDDFGMATANAIAGVNAGATHVGVTVNGLGERAGNAALEEVVMALKYLLDFDMEQKTQKLRELCEYVAKASNRILPSWKAIVGTSVFTHESGIHADGALKNPRTYEVFDPEDVGLKRRFVVGKHSGTAGVKKKLEEYNIFIDDDLAKEILESVRRTAVELKRPLNDIELLNLYYEHVNKDMKHVI
jgi:homocitrate synthase NifV